MTGWQNLGFSNSLIFILTLRLYQVVGVQIMSSFSGDEIKDFILRMSYFQNNACNRKTNMAVWDLVPLWNRKNIFPNCFNCIHIRLWAFWKSCNTWENMKHRLHPFNETVIKALGLLLAPYLKSNDQLSTTVAVL